MHCHALKLAFNQKSRWALAHGVEPDARVFGQSEPNSTLSQDSALV